MVCTLRVSPCSGCETGHPSPPFALRSGDNLYVPRTPRSGATASALRASAYRGLPASRFALPWRAAPDDATLRCWIEEEQGIESDVPPGNKMQASPLPRYALMVFDCGALIGEVPTEWSDLIREPTIEI